MANVYYGENIEDFIFNENATYDSLIVESDDEAVSDEEMNECGIIECVDDPEVAGYRIALENEQNYNMIIGAFLNEEYSYLVNEGTEMVYESGKIRSFFSAIQEAISKFWAKIQGLFKKVMSYISSYLRTNKSFVKKYKGKNIPTPPNKTFHGYNFTNVVPDFVKCRDFITAAVGLMDLASVTDDNVEEKVKDIKDKHNATKNLMRGAMCGGKSVEAEDYAKELKIAMYGSQDKVKLDSIPFSKLIEDLESGKKAKEEVNEAYKSAKTAVARLKGDIKTAEKKLKDSDNKSAAMKVARCYTDTVSAAISIMSVAHSAHSRKVNAMLRQSRLMASYYVANKGESAKTESARLSDIETELGITLI